MTDFAQAFQNDQNNISDAVEQDQSAASQVILSHNANSHDFFDELGGIYSQNAFLSPIIRINPFCTSQKPPQASVKTFLRIKGFLFEIWCFHHSLLMRYFKMCIKTGWWKPSYCLGALFSSAQLMAFAVLLLAVIKQRCITAGAPFWIEGELPVFVVRPHAPNRYVRTVTVRFEYRYRSTPEIHIYIYIYIYIFFFFFFFWFQWNVL